MNDNCDGGNRIQPPPSQTTASSPSDAAATSSLPKVSKPSNVFNPYKKETPNHSIIEDPRSRKRKEFVEKYRAQALHHGCKSRRDSGSISQRGTGVPSASVLDLLRTSQQWRHSWQNVSGNSTKRQSLRENLDTMPLRPRLFLFHQHIHSNLKREPLQQSQMQYNRHSCTNDGLNRDAERRQMPRRHQEGVWELDIGITELAGEGGSGKTQICLSLCVTCALMPLMFPGDEGVNNLFTGASANAQAFHNNHYTSIYVTMGEGIPAGVLARRMEKMICARQEIDEPNDKTMELLSRIGLLSMRNEDEFAEFVEQDLPQLLASQHREHRHRQATKIGLIAFDGIAGFFRFSDPLFQRSQNPAFHRQRGSKLLRISSQLRKLSDLYDFPILITNQVTACMPPIAGISSSDVSSFSSTSDQVVPALGLLWSNCVSTRILLLRKDGVTMSVPDQDGSHGNQNKLRYDKENCSKKETKVVRVKMARILQSVNMPAERELWFVIESREVAAVA